MSQKNVVREERPVTKPVPYSNPVTSKPFSSAIIGKKSTPTTVTENPTLGVQRMNQEKEKHPEYPKAYAPIPKRVIKEEDTSGENDVEQQMMYPLAYPPLPRDLVKEEALCGDAQEESNGQAQQLMASSPTSNGNINEELERSKEEHNAFNLDEGQQENLGGELIAYPPVPRGVIKNEPLEEKEGDKQPQQVIIAYPPIARGRIKEETQSDANQDGLNVDEQQLDLEPIIAYPPIPRRGVIIKDELLEEKEGEEQAKQVIAYPPIPRGRIKEECVDNPDDFNLEKHQLIPQEEGNQNLVEESTPAPIITATTNVQTEDRVNGTEQRKYQRRKKIAIVSTAAISPSPGSDDQFAKKMPTISSQTRRSFQLERGSTSITRDTDGEKNGNSTLGRGNGTQRPKSKKRRITDSTADTPSSTESGDQSAKPMSTISSRTRRISQHQLKRGKTFMTREADEENDDHSTSESNDFGEHKSNETVPTISSRTRSHHSKPGSASMARDAIEKTSEKRKVNKEKGTKEKQQQSTKDDKRNETSENSSLSIDGDSSSSSDETSERPSDSHNKFSCKECGRGFQRKCSLRLHFLKSHTGTGQETSRPLNSFKCDKCMKIYKTKNNLVQHLMKECQLDPAFPCSQCDYKATRKSNLRKHLTSIHKVDSSQLDKVSAAAALRVRPFKCEKCEGTFTSKITLNCHKKRVCGVAKSFSCVKCDYRTAQKSNLRNHLMYVHDVEPSQLANFGAGKEVRPQMPYKCDKCEHSYNRKHNLKRHMDFECGKSPSFPCTQCGYRATQNASLKRHIEAVHGASSSSLQA